MRTLVISDLHSNFDALRAVLNRVRRKRFDQVFCLGDFVGYGGQPNQVLDRMRTLREEKLFVRGNHDRVAGGFDSGEAFNHAARSAALWTRDHLSPVNRSFLRGLPVGPIVERTGVMVCHGSPVDEDHYLFGEGDAYEILNHYSAPVIFFGHTHLPAVFRLSADGDISAKIYRSEATVQLHREDKYLINPGSVGQPRDRNPAAACLIFDRQKYTVQFIRVPYDISRAQAAILRAGLPRVLADRLAVGS
jgi:predicted phosphodiesterase